MTTISPQDLRKRLDAEPGLVLFDVRTPIEFMEVHIPEARCVPLDELHPARLLTPGGLAADQVVFLICHTGRRAVRARERLVRGGVGQPVVVEGGMLAWMQAGLPVHRGGSGVIGLDRQIRIAAGALAFAGAVLAWFVHPAFVVLSGFVGAGLVFAGITGFCGMGLLIARLPWNQHKSGH